MEVLDIETLSKAVQTGRRDFLDHEMNPYLAPQFNSNQGSFRMLISGRSGAGKTNLIVSALMQNQIKFEHLYLYVRDPSQSKYQLLMMWIKAMEDMYEKEQGEFKAFATVVTSPDDIIHVDDLDPNVIKVAIFDDLLLEKNQSLIEEYYVRGRHRNVSCIYLTQDYHKTSSIVRKQSEYYAIFGVSSKAELIQLSKDHSLDHDYKDFKLILTRATQPRTSFLLIDRRTDLKLLMLRKNWDQLLDENLEFHPIASLNERYLR